MQKQKIIVAMLLFVCIQSFAQEAPVKFNITGTMGISYEGYGLNRNPDGWIGYLPRRP